MSKEFESTVVKQPTETDGGVELHARTPDPVYIVTDFGNHLSPAECDAAINNIYRSRGFLHGTTPSVHDIESFDFIDGAFQLRQLSITHDLPLHPYDAERATVSHKPGVFGAVVDPGVGTNRRVVVVDT
ncbi:MAG TPA: hypothetical protein VLF20_03315, partial [Patescibacteria group bacterium]|nr:hypothetical protein [Patescibacteria group bacterium]